MIVEVSGSVDISLDIASRVGPLPAAARQVLHDEIVVPLRESLLSGAWPVDTGASLQAWEIRAVAPDFVAIRNPIEYAEFVHRAGEEVEVWTELEALSEELLSSLLPRLRALSRRPTRQIPLRLLSRSVVRAGTLFASKVRALSQRSTRRREARARSTRRRNVQRRSIR